MFWINPDPFCPSHQIYTINKESISRTPLKSNTHFKFLFMDTIPATYSKSLPKHTTFANYLLIVYDYFNISKLYGMENITTEEVMERPDMFQEIFGKVDAFCCWDMEIIQTDVGIQFTSKEFQ